MNKKANALRIFIKRLINSVICSFYICILHSLPSLCYLMSQHFICLANFIGKKVELCIFYYILVRHIHQACTYGVNCDLFSPSKCLINVSINRVQSVSCMYNVHCAAVVIHIKQNLLHVCDVMVEKLCENVPKKQKQNRINLDHHKYSPYMPGTYNVIYYSSDLKMERLILCLADGRT